MASEESGGRTHQNPVESRLPDDCLEAVVTLGMILWVGGSMYLRGLLDGSDLPRGELAEQIVMSGPYWPIVVASIGAVLMLAGGATMLAEMRN